ncbi:MAG: isoprenylcysteine carboxylmethyltransferase family protein [Candidatus Nanopelagicales bacterium]
MARRRTLTDRLLEQSTHEYSLRTRFVALLLLAPIFLFVLPCLFVRLGAELDQRMQCSPVLSPPSNLFVGFLLILPSLLLGLWANHSQFTAGRGTPVPLMATQALIVQPPYTYSRNPMALGAVGMYLGVALLFRSIGAVILVLIFAAALLTYIRLCEEREMAARFGPEYQAYKRRTPFLIPRVRMRR